MKQIVIGRLGNQPFQITDDTVSREHAKLYYDLSSHVMIIENISKNSGTYIRQNGGPFIQVMPRCNIDPQTEIRLGPRYVIRASQLISGSRPKPPVAPQRSSAEKKLERVDIAFLRRVAEHYESEKLRLDQKSARYNNLRSGFMPIGMLATVAGTILTHYLGNNESLTIVVGVSILTLAAVLWWYIDRSTRNIIPEKSKNDKDYKIKYCCPKCHFPLAGRLYENILATGKCPNCKVEYYDSKI